MTKTLRQRFADKEFITAPGVFDGISARIADRLGFPALYMTGYGTVASHLGMPDAGLASYTEMVGRVETLTSVTSTPLIADGDTGYGGLLNVQRTVRGYEKAGAAAIQLEDQEFPKKCGHTPGRRVIPMADMVGKVKVAVESRDSADFLIIARTDARTTLGLDEALRRGEAYAEAGADIIFIESPESEAEMEKICASFDVPCLANMVEGGRTPVVSRDRLVEIGYALAIFPATGFLAVGAALNSVYSTLKQEGSSVGVTAPMDNFGDFTRLMGFQEVWDFEKRHAQD
ncbi:isocitrate lyase/PEP mutase family protein [Oceanibaculum pacificum]|uniref:Carboxyvinyl-carboxyphosphonate phosphorylmutase n=1 Tax=Oceanibaculum pacificum TaxID=580166 RepID=A0A154V8U1_9PROT|nr:isocitrate lyase/PEP mutase family protein [Oceanibaculum pacificum]KZC97654.1 carboxyvinyl-carboxyphosphonate phosphorylmutase [Oceanibaculum pacificum]